uniref:TNase-like domain-containing protein n=1 Tax=Attheya septentrionalis TaxID=420275 RepID=A0A7S2UEN5_9STRA
MSTVAVAAPSYSGPAILPERGVAKVKSVLSGDTVVLIGRAVTPQAKAPEIVFTLERITAPRVASKANDNVDEPGAFAGREWLRALTVGKNVMFETRKQGASAGDRVYGLLFLQGTECVPQTSANLNLAVECVRNGHATPKVFGDSYMHSDSPVPDASDEATDANGNVHVMEGADPVADAVRDYERQLQLAFQEAKAAGLGVHGPAPLVRTMKNAGDDFQTLELVEKTQKLCSGSSVKCVIEHIFDGSRFRCIVTDDDMATAGLQYSSFTLILAGVAAPRIANARLETSTEPFGDEAREFVQVRLLHRELNISLHGTDKSGVCAVGTVHHPRGNIAVELLKNGLARISEWSARMMNTNDLPALRIAEINAKRAQLKVWQHYEAPSLSGASEISGTVMEVLTGDTVSILPAGQIYDSEAKLQKVSLASIRAPRLGNEKYGKPDEPYAYECKDRLRVLTVGKEVKVDIHYERDIPMGENTEKRQFGTISSGKREDVGEVLVAEGLAVTQRHRDDDEKSPRYDELCAAENDAKTGKKGVHSVKEYGRRTVNDLTNPQKAKAYSGSLMRAGPLKAIVDYVFNGSRFKLLVPSENCYVMFALENLRCPQPSPNPGARAVKPAEPFGDISKRHARSTLMQRTVEITCTGVTMGGVITGDLMVGQGGQRRDFCLEMISSGLATVDQRKIDYGEAPRKIVEAQTAAQNNRVGIWSLEQEKRTEAPSRSTLKAKEEIATVRLSEIRSGNHVFLHIVGSEAAKVVDESMKLFTSTNGTGGAPCDIKVGKVVAALFDDGTGKSWYRAKILERKGPKAKVLYLDHGNVGMVSAAAQLRPLDPPLSTDRIPAVAKEAQLALIKVRSLDDDEGVEAARMLQQLCWGKNLTARIHCEVEGKLVVTLSDAMDPTPTVNERLVSAGLARAPKPMDVEMVTSKMSDGQSIVSLADDLKAAQDDARKSRIGMWRYGDVGDEDEEE